LHLHRIGYSPAQSFSAVHRNAGSHLPVSLSLMVQQLGSTIETWKAGLQILESAQMRLFSVANNLGLIDLDDTGEEVQS